jgi:hypothetical protein
MAHVSSSTNITNNQLENATISSARFLVPCFFLLALGIGNITVGTFKYEQYDEIIKDLESRPPSNSVEDTVSPLQRLKSTIDTPPRSLAHEKKAQARKDFYQLVLFGGRVFLAMGGIYFIAFLLNKFRGL